MLRSIATLVRHSFDFARHNTSFIRTIQYDIRSTLHDITRALYEFISISPHERRVEVSLVGMKAPDTKITDFHLESNDYSIG